METERKQKFQVKGEDVVKVVKQPMFIAGAAAIVLSIVIAIVGSMLNPAKPAVIDKYEKALQKQDLKLLSECYSPTAGKDSSELSWELASYKMLLQAAGITGTLQMEYLVGEPTVQKLENGKEVTQVPAVLVLKSGGKVKYVSLDGKTLIEVKGKEYFYTGRE